MCKRWQGRRRYMIMMTTSVYMQTWSLVSVTQNYLSEDNWHAPIVFILLLIAFQVSLPTSYIYNVYVYVLTMHWLSYKPNRRTISCAGIQRLKLNKLEGSKLDERNSDQALIASRYRIQLSICFYRWES